MRTLTFKYNLKIVTIVGAFVGLLVALYDINAVLLGSETNIIPQLIDLMWPALVFYVLFSTIAAVILGSITFIMLRIGEYRIQKNRLIAIQTGIHVLVTSSAILPFVLGIKRLPIEFIFSIFFLSAFCAFSSGALVYYIIRRHSLWRVITIGLIIILFLFPLSLLAIGIKNNISVYTNFQANKAVSIKRPNILWIVMDTARADHFSSYGYKRKTTPEIDRVAREGVIYKNAISTSIWTLPSHTSMFTGLFPSEHGVDADWQWLGDSFTTIAEIMHKNGYNTAGFSNNIFVSKKTNLSQGFDTFMYFKQQTESGSQALILSQGLKKIQNYFKQSKILFKLYNFINPFERKYGTAENTNRAVKNYIDRVSNKSPFFIFINYMELHEPFGDTPGAKKYLEEIGLDYPTTKLKDTAIESNTNNYVSHTDVFAEKDKKIVNALYDGDLAFLDSKIGELVAYLQDKKILDNTVIIITGDHGTNLGEHNKLEHFFDMHSMLTHIPLIIRYPKLFTPGKIEERIVQTIDIFPTILDVAQIDTFDKKTIRGFDLFDEGRPQIAFSETLLKADFTRFPGALYFLKDKSTDQRVLGGDWESLRTRDDEYIVQNSLHEYLYNIKGDPKELHNLVDSDNRKLKEMRSLLKEFRGKLNHYWYAPFLFQVQSSE